MGLGGSTTKLVCRQFAYRLAAAEDGSAVLAVLLDALLVTAVVAHDFGDVVSLEVVALLRVVAEEALVGLKSVETPN